MAKWWENTKRVNHSRKRHKRFLTLFDMSEAKRAESILNSHIKRGELERLPHGYMCDCGCGCEGCIIVSQYK
jgi:hypothetical protein